jgi:hypothetical protein
MLLQYGHALGYASVTDMSGCARHKASDRVGLAAVKRAAQTVWARPQQVGERCKRLHIRTIQAEAG